MVKSPTDASFLWKVLWWFAHLVRPLFCKLHIEGLENVPLARGCVLASNHRSGNDIIVKGYTCPRQVHYMAKLELFQINALVSLFFRTFGVFPVDRSGRDIGALDEAIALVRTGKLICIYPEGTRSRDGILKRGKNGAARIAMAADAPVIPVITLNSENMWRGLPHIRWRRPTMVVRFGKPIFLGGDPSQSVDVRHETKRIMQGIAELLPPELRGIYAEAARDLKSPVTTE
jgi:1-acyl-sn-glycerol-3-phosphate acyltransferase